MIKQSNTQRRLVSILQGAFAGSPTQLKDIPKKSGESRKQRVKTQRKRGIKKGA
jgi:hypothetical protein